MEIHFNKKWCHIETCKFTKQINWFIYLWYKFSLKGISEYTIASHESQGLFPIVTFFLPVLTFTGRRSMLIFVMILFIAGISATTFSVLMKLFECFLMKKFPFSINANRFLTGKFETRLFQIFEWQLQRNLVIWNNFLRWRSPKTKTDYLYWLNNEQNLIGLSRADFRFSSSSIFFLTISVLMNFLCASSLKTFKILVPRSFPIFSFPLSIEIHWATLIFAPVEAAFLWRS